MPRNEKKIRVERGLYRAGETYYACATPPGARTALWRSLGRVGLMEARRRRDRFAAEVLPGARPTLITAQPDHAGGGAVELSQAQGRGRRRCVPADPRCSGFGRRPCGR